MKITNDMVPQVEEFWTPWGLATKWTVIEMGLVKVVAPQGAGFMTRKKWMGEKLSKPARERGHWYNRYWWCYSSRWEWATIALEIFPRHWSEHFEGFAPEVLERPKDYLIRLLSLHALDYLEEAGYEPMEPEATRWQRRQEFDRLLEDEDPDAVVMVSGGEWRTGDPSVLEVKTADDRYHNVTRASYEQADQDLPLLSDMETVKMRPRLRIV